MLNFLMNCQWMESQNLVISLEYSWFLAKSTVFYDPASLQGEKYIFLFYISGKGFFVDFEFSHNDKTTMGDLMLDDVPVLESGVRWRRPREICENPRLFVDGPSRFDISQGNFLDLISNALF